MSNFTVKTRKYYFYTHRISMETTILSAKFDSKYQNRLTNDLIIADYYTHYYTHLWEANNRVSSHKSIVDPHAEESYTYRHDTFSASRARDIVIRINQYSELFFTSVLSNPINDLCLINTSRKYKFPILIHTEP